MEFVDQLGPASLQQDVPTRRVAMVGLVWRRKRVLPLMAHDGLGFASNVFTIVDS